MIAVGTVSVVCHVMICYRIVFGPCVCLQFYAMLYDCVWPLSMIVYD